MHGHQPIPRSCALFFLFCNAVLSTVRYRFSLWQQDKTFMPTITWSALYGIMNPAGRKRSERRSVSRSHAAGRCPYLPEHGRGPVSVPFGNRDTGAYGQKAFRRPFLCSQCRTNPEPGTRNQGTPPQKNRGTQWQCLYIHSNNRRNPSIMFRLFADSETGN